jgi:hypothetical protein
MKKFLFCLLMLLPSLGWSQSAANATQGANYAAVGTGTPLNISVNGVFFHRLTWTPNGTVATCQVQLEGSLDNVTYNAITPSEPCATAGRSVIVSGNVNFVRVNLTTLTGGGTVNLVYSGYVNLTVVDDNGNLTVTFSYPTTNPCHSAAVNQSSVPINITTAATTQLVAGVGGQQITVCGFTVAMVGTITADTFLLEYGTGGTCTSPTTLTGPISSGVLTAGATVFVAPAQLKPSANGESLCAVTTVGIGPSIQGSVTFVQR